MPVHKNMGGQINSSFSWILMEFEWTTLILCFVVFLLGNFFSLTCCWHLICIATWSRAPCLHLQHMRVSQRCRRLGASKWCRFWGHSSSRTLDKTRGGKYTSYDCKGQICKPRYRPEGFFSESTSILRLYANCWVIYLHWLMISAQFVPSFNTFKQIFTPGRFWLHRVADTSSTRKQQQNWIEFYVDIDIYMIYQ